MQIKKAVSQIPVSQGLKSSSAAANAILNSTTHFTGDESQCSRPMKPLFEVLTKLGAEICSENGHAPFSATWPMRRKEVSLSGDISSQFISGILLSAPPAGITLHLKGNIVSAPYIEMTCASMQNRGMVVEKTPDGYFISSGQKYKPASVTLLGDYSASAFLLAAVTLCRDVTVTNLTHDTHQADELILLIMESFSADVTQNETSVRIRKIFAQCRY